MNFTQRRLSKAAAIKLRRIKEHLSIDDSIIDIGTGNGALASLLLHSKYKLTTLDVQNKSRFPKIRPIVYDGTVMPFEDCQFDTALLITMLHHTPNPQDILFEAKRISSKIVIIEDVYRNQLQKCLTKLVDSIVNWEFRGHPHTNKSDKEWLQLFKELGLKLEYKNEQRFFLLFRQVTYVLKTS